MPPTSTRTTGAPDHPADDARPPRFAYVLPTHNRPEVLDVTLRRIAHLPPHDAEIVIADNASDRPVAALLRDGLGGVTRGELPLHAGPAALPVHVVRNDANLGAAGRNAAAQASDPSCRWLVMLDDDSWPEPEPEPGPAPRSPHDPFGLLDALADADARPDVGAIAGEITLTDGGREAGGLPEVVIGCGCAVRRDAFIALAGYDPAFNYYAEEYDLAARLIAMGLRTVTDRRARFTHAKVAAGRDMDRILARLVRNNGWVMQRYAPDAVRSACVRHVVERYRRIARKEHAERGWQDGYAELLRTLRSQPRTPLTPRQWDRFTGKAAARRGLLAAWAESPFAVARVVREGKGAEIVREVLSEMGVRVLAAERAEPAERSEQAEQSDALVIGTLSPGPMWDALDAETAASPSQRVIAPWRAEPPHSTHKIVNTTMRAGRRVA